jgi:hypothetical protein
MGLSKLKSCIFWRSILRGWGADGKKKERVLIGSVGMMVGGWGESSLDEIVGTSKNHQSFDLNVKQSNEG